MELGINENKPYALKNVSVNLPGDVNLKIIRIPAESSDINGEPDNRELHTKDPIFKIYREKVVKVRVGPEEAL